MLRGWDLDVVVGPHALERRRHLAGTDEHRAADLQAAWCDPAVRAVLCARGGSGAPRMVDLLDWDAMRAAGPRVLVGFSDVTALHQAFATRLGLVTLYGPMAAADVDSSGTTPDAVGAAPPGHAVRPRSRPASSQAAACGPGGRTRPRRHSRRHPRPARHRPSAPRAPAGAGAGAVIEDVGEPAYRIDRMLTQLLRTGWFDGVAGIVLGSWGDCGPDAEPLVERLAARRAAGLRAAVRPRGAAAHRPARRRGGAGRRRRHPALVQPALR